MGALANQLLRILGHTYDMIYIVLTAVIGSYYCLTQGCPTLRREMVCVACRVKITTRIGVAGLRFDSTGYLPILGSIPMLK